MVTVTTRRALLVWCVALAALAVSGARCEEQQQQQRRLLWNGSFGINAGFSKAVSDDVARSFSSPHYDGSATASGSLAEVGEASRSFATGDARAASHDAVDEEATEADASTEAVMSNFGVPSGETRTRFGAASLGRRAHAASNGRDAFLATPTAAGAVASSGSAGAFSNRDLVYLFRMEPSLSPSFPSQYFTTLG
ncbi:hypothetical protein HOP50_05g40540 [Chloropicon primus]|uniref:Uncharacterized protein n=1 Tax=Chloropicon primus TaxID=1764295 RepID=A0A5B8MM53_9CHLO|nr:hypothetical protein A3770_05p40450 [Chloropicon primus]UPR00738.1 hypothetical protein HOP50_05g40540 [Chloropicon primus]|mmetsp:Transcript_4727/g.14104  ORF Transcript_4727/g.14104 Transcript_4727/m.14104 type:complete len:195 (-) Transcript_4727:614-1198(-)|eukprot:QDZ21527.1 hypothetical protein A3770_05p40450 [Chloropicon primus]